MTVLILILWNCYLCHMRPYKWIIMRCSHFITSQVLINILCMEERRHSCNVEVIVWKSQPWVQIGSVSQCTCMVMGIYTYAYGTHIIYAHAIHMIYIYVYMYVYHFYLDLTDVFSWLKNISWYGSTTIYSCIYNLIFNIYNMVSGSMYNLIFNIYYIFHVHIYFLLKFHYYKSCGSVSLRIWGNIFEWEIQGQGYAFQ